MLAILVHFRFRSCQISENPGAQRSVGAMGIQSMPRTAISPENLRSPLVEFVQGPILTGYSGVIAPEGAVKSTGKERGMIGMGQKSVSDHSEKLSHGHGQSNVNGGTMDYIEST